MHVICSRSDKQACLFPQEGETAVSDTKATDSETCNKERMKSNKTNKKKNLLILNAEMKIGNKHAFYCYTAGMSS